MDCVKHESETTIANTNQKANMISRQCLTDRHAVLTSRIVFDFMIKMPSFIFKHQESSSQK